MHDSLHESTLDAFLDEALSTREMARIEQLLRADPRGVEQLASIRAQRDAGVHSLGAIWRRYRLSCPSREDLGNYLLGVLDKDQTERIRLHLETVECRYCQANLADLQARAEETSETIQRRRRRYFESSIGRL
ncbi:MAG: hypothetical protein PVH19_10280 [Planctomycetia bacterium]|jgi:anti-sigma factor RsiW